MTIEQLVQQATPRDVDKALARVDFMSFVKWTFPEYSDQPFHHRIAKELQDFAEHKTRRLILSVPPQHGKSELVSRRLPAYLLGVDPDLKIVLASYAASLSRKFNRSVQRTIDSHAYNEIFPNTTLNRSNVKTSAQGSWLRNSDEFEVVDHRGGMFAVGVGGALTGNPADVAIIDDPVKGMKEAVSPVTRSTIWEWYDSVLATRLHNDSRVLICMTRWHEDDLVGRIMEKVKADSGLDEEEKENWKVVNIPAIKEDDKDPEDPRKIGQALWPAKHSLKKLREAERRSKRTFVSLYQGKPHPDDGELIMKDWFSRISYADLLKYARDQDAAIIPCFYIDGAETENEEKNDPTCIMAGCRVGNIGVVLGIARVWKKLPDLVRFLPKFIDEIGYEKQSRIKVEPKNIGRPLHDLLHEGTTYNVSLDEPPKESKVVRVEGVTPVLESGRIYVLKGEPWVDGFLDECAFFPNAVHDDQVDTLEMMVRDLFPFKKRGGGLRTSVGRHV